MKIGKLFLIVAAGMLAYAGAAYSQTEKRVIEAPKPPPIEIDKVTASSPSVTLSAVGKEVAPGVLEVSRSSVRGKRLVIPRTGPAQHVCIGTWVAKTSTCEGSYIE